MEELPKIIVIVGATSSGKTSLALEVAKRFNGEVISADSRQIYKKMSIGTGKPDGQWKSVDRHRVYMVSGVPHHLMDILDPGKQMSAAEFKDKAIHTIAGILERGNVPIIAGGTGLYVWAVVDNLIIPQIAPNKKLRRSLEEKELPELQLLLNKIDPETCKTIDMRNPRRVIRALEVAILTGDSFSQMQSKKPALYNALQIGIQHTNADLFKKIDERIDGQIKDGLVKETDKLLKQKYSWQLPSMSSIGYRQMSEYLRGERPLVDAVASMKTETHKYARRQITWFKRDKRIVWIPYENIEKEAFELIKNFLKK